MNDKLGPYHVVDLSPGRRVWVNTLDLSWPSHTMYGLLEVDVTVPRKFIAEHKARTGESLSFAGFLTFCVARAVDEDKSIQAYRKGDKQLVLFDDVNVGLMVQRHAPLTRFALLSLNTGGTHVPSRRLKRRTCKRSVNRMARLSRQPFETSDS